MNCLDFLRKVLPDDGYYCAVVIEDKRRRQRFFKSVSELADFIHEHRFSNVYHACATFKDPTVKKPRGHHNVQWLRSLWLDIDIGRNDGYQDFKSAFNAIGAFIKKVGIPTPLFIFTGGGLHLYWPFFQNISPEQWILYAKGLRAACQKWGFKVDHHRTVDHSSILRPVETVNTKYEDNNVVTLLKDAGPYDLAKFSILLLYEKGEVSKENKEFAPVDPRIVIGSCQQMNSFALGNTQEEPLWRACGSILAGCTKGKELYHRISALDPRYDEEETEKKWEGIKEFNVPTGCAWFREHYGSICNGCNFGGKNPLFLARDTQKEEEKAKPEPIIYKQEELPVLEYPYEFNEKGKLVLIKRSKKDGDVQEDRYILSEFPIVVKNVYGNEQEGRGYSIGIRTHTEFEGWQNHSFSIAELNKDPADIFAKLNIPFVNAKEILGYINSMHARHKMEQAPGTAFETFGWKKEGFLIGDTLYHWRDGKFGKTRVTLGGEAVMLAGALRPGGRKGFRSNGLEAWRKAAQRLFDRGHEWQALTLLTSLVAPLLAFVPMNEGGVILSLADSEGGKGKTLATIAAASVWGDFFSLNCIPGDTLNARFAKIATLGNIPTFFDEQSRDTPKIANEFVKTFTVGREKERVDRSGGKNRIPRSWKTILISNANNELAGSIRSAMGSDAMADRVLEINTPALPLNKKELNNDMKEAFLEYCGYAGPLVIYLYLRNMKKIIEQLPERINYYNSYLGRTKDRFVAALLAVSDIGYNIIAESQLLTFDPKERIEYIISQIRNNSSELDTGYRNEELLSIFLRGRIEETLITYKYVPNRKIVPKYEPRRKLSIRVELDTREMYIPKRDLNTFLQEAQRSTKEFVKELEDMGVIKQRTHKKNLGAGTHFSTAQDYCFVLDLNHPLLDQELAEAQDLRGTS